LDLISEMKKIYLVEIILKLFCFYDFSIGVLSGGIFQHFTSGFLTVRV
jgi:hypothetical protein